MEDFGTERIRKNVCINSKKGLAIISSVVFVIAIFTACSSVQPAAQVQPTVLPEMAVALPDPTATVEPTQVPVVAEADWLQVASKEGDLFVLGNPNAPIRLVDYSDFL